MCSKARRICARWWGSACAAASSARCAGGPEGPPAATHAHSAAMAPALQTAFHRSGDTLEPARVQDAITLDQLLLRK